MEIKIYFEHTQKIIDQNIHKFIYVLMKSLFLGKLSIKQDSQKKLYNFIKYLNSKGIKINLEDTSISNFRKIMNFIRKNSFLLAGEIMENIIIRVLSFAFRAPMEEFFGKYVYNNLSVLKTAKANIRDWFNNELLKQLFDDPRKRLDDMLSFDNKIDYNCPFIRLLWIIEIFKSQSFNLKIKSKNHNSETTTKDTTSIYNLDSEYIINENGKIKRSAEFPFTTSIIYSIYIYHRNLISPLMNYSKDSESLEKLPFVFQLSEAGINNVYLEIILRPIRIEPRIEDIELDKNCFGSEGILELYKAMIFNKSIKKISIKSCLIKSLSLMKILKSIEYFENNNIEELDISSNYLQSDADEYLVKLISSLKELKILNLSFNILKCGLGPLFAALKNLYRYDKSKLETLILVNCNLDDISYYELGELLKSKYCKMKVLCLNENTIPTNSNFFKAIKKNKSLEELYLYGCGITSDKTDEIDRIISNTNLEYLYLNSNGIHDFNQYIRIIYKNSMIKNENEQRKKDIKFYNACLYNLNLSNSELYNQNSEKIKLIKNIVNKTNLLCLDITFTLKDKHNEKNLNFYYCETVDEIVNILKNENEIYKKAINEIFVKEIEKKYYEEKIKEKFNYDYKNIDLFVKDPKAINHVFILKIAKELVSEKSFNSKKEKKDELDKLVNYIKLRRIIQILKENKKIRSDKKLILV